MKEITILLIDLIQSSPLSGTLRGILESSAGFGINFHQESVGSEELREGERKVLSNLFSRLRPAMIFLIFSARFLRQAQELSKLLTLEFQGLPVIVIAEADEPDVMFEMIKIGATDFILPPLRAAEILPRVCRVLDLTEWGERLTQTFQERPWLGSLIGKSPAFIAVINKIPIVAQCDASVLIAGETGTGKELCARAIHHLSARADRPFIPINCGAIPTDLLENELFGHERGAYTGAVTSRPGLIEEADGGTLFLDEIDSLPLMAQVKFLRFIQEKEYRLLGSAKIRHADVRIITATNIDIDKAVRAGKLRQDLYYRLNIIPLMLPPLRERKDDIAQLATHFLAVYAAKFKKRVTCLSSDATRKLMMYEWPGNVRELEHVIERAVALSEGPIIRGADLLLPLQEIAARSESFQEAKAKFVAQFEHTYLQGLLLAYQVNVTKAAEAARKDRRAFWRLLRKYKIDVNSFRIQAS
jgi:DNA-binding NtrC family response regulator